MRMQRAALPILLGFLASAAPALAASTSVTTSSDGTTIVNGKPCRVVTGHGGGSGSNSTTVTAGGGAVSGSTTVSPGGSGASSSVTTGSGSSSSGTHSSSAAGSDCVIYRDAPKK
jgi:hypothetical protein